MNDQCSNSVDDESDVSKKVIFFRIKKNTYFQSRRHSPSEQSIEPKHTSYLKKKILKKILI